MEKDLEIQRLKEENAKLLKNNSAKADLVSINVHQIRTSLSALKWIIKMFLDQDLGKLTAEQSHLLNKAYDGTERAINITNDLLSTNKTENIIEKEYLFTEVDIIDLIESAVFDFSGESHNRGIEIIFLKPNFLVKKVRADKEKLRIILQNLIENAIKYSNMHGKIFITLLEKDRFIEVAIKDGGIGISEEGKKKIFEKFYRDPVAEKKEKIGSGIGLFTTKTIVEKHNGKIWFESKEGNGTTFFFTIPILE